MKKQSDEMKLFVFRLLAGLELPAGYVLRLFTNRTHPTEQSALLDFTEAREGGGYAAYEVQPSDWSWDGLECFVTHRWNFDGTKDMDVTGWYLTYWPVFVVGTRFKDQSGKDDVQKVRRRGDWIEATATLK